MTPNTGDEFETEFSVTFDSESTLSIFEAYGITKRQGYENQKIPLLPQIGKDNTATMTLPDVNRLEIVLEDENGELVSVETDPVIITSAKVIDETFVE